MKYHQGQYRITKMAAILGVSRRGYYTWLKSKPNRHEQKDQELLVLIIQIFEEHKGRYGSLRIWQELKDTHKRQISLKRVEHLMREHKLQAKRTRKWVRTTDWQHGYQAAENLLARQFKASFPGEKWVSDITYLTTNNDFLYLTVILDPWDRKIIGWNIARDMRTENVCKALTMAIVNRRPRKGLLFHSDREVQYCSPLLTGTLKSSCPEVRQSMSRKGNCWDNACAETFFKTLKR